jgi:RNA polymerase sigma-70 factor (ECF subfamily)
VVCARRRRHVRRGSSVAVSVTSFGGSSQAQGVSPRATPDARSDFRSVFEEQFDYVWNTLRHLGVAARDLEDLVHDVFVRVDERLADYDPSRPLRPWLFAFAFRVASDYRRLARHRVEVLGTATEHADTAPGADEQLIASEDQALAEAALLGIEIERRAVFILHELDGISVPETARALGIPQNTAYSRLRIARQEFAETAKRLLRAKGRS